MIGEGNSIRKNGLNKLPNDRVWRTIFGLLLYLCFHGSDYLTICYVCDTTETTTFVNLPPIYLGHAWTNTAMVW